MNASLSEWLQWIEQQHHTSIELGLDRIKRVYTRLGSPKIADKVITVAGTNGKGSTATALSSMLQTMQCKTGVYTSPHLLRFNERISINGQCIDDTSLINCFEKVHSAMEEDSLSFFEFTTLSAWVYFSNQTLDVAVLEIGLGGRLDAVNLIDPDIAVITSIALDHQDWLGDDLEGIAFEKAGILREKIPFVCGETPVSGYLTDLGHQKKCDVFMAKEDFSIIEQGGDVVWQSITPTLPHQELRLNKVHLPLNSIAVSLMVMHCLYPNFELNRFKDTLSNIKLKGRYQKEKSFAGFDVIFDVAHNPASVELLDTMLTKESYTGRKVAVFSALKDKDVQAMASCICNQFDHWFVAEIANNDRAQTKEKLSEELSLLSGAVTISKNLLSAYTQAYAELKPNDCLVVFGSFYVLAELFKDESNLNILEGAA